MRLADVEALHARGCARRGGMCGDIAPPDPAGGGRYVCTRDVGHASDQHEARSSTGQLFASWRPLTWTTALEDR